MDIATFLLTSSIALGLSSAGAALPTDDAGDAPERARREHRSVAADARVERVPAPLAAGAVPPNASDDAP